LQKFLGWVKLGVMEADKSPPPGTAGELREQLRAADSRLTLLYIKAAIADAQYEMLNPKISREVTRQVNNRRNSLNICQIPTAEANVGRLKARLAAMTKAATRTSQPPPAEDEKRNLC
jgi:hypothetical protein